MFIGIPSIKHCKSSFAYLIMEKRKLCVYHKHKYLKLFLILNIPFEANNSDKFFISKNYIGHVILDFYGTLSIILSLFVLILNMLFCNNHFTKCGSLEVEMLSSSMLKASVQPFLDRHPQKSLHVIGGDVISKQCIVWFLKMCSY